MIKLAKNDTFVMFGKQVNGVNSGSVLWKNTELARMSLVRMEDTQTKYHINWNVKQWEQVSCQPSAMKFLFFCLNIGCILGVPK